MDIFKFFVHTLSLPETFIIYKQKMLRNYYLLKTVKEVVDHKIIFGDFVLITQLKMM